MTMIDGETVADCFALVARYGTELEALEETLENLISEQLKADKESLPCVLAGEVEWGNRCSKHGGWVCTDEAGSIPLKSKGKGKSSIEKYLGFQISMTGNGINIPGNKEPLLHVFNFDAPVNFEDNFLIGFPFTSVDFSEDPYKILDERLISWGKRDGIWNEQEWVYSLHLMSINSIDDLKKYIVTPALALLKGGNIRDALPDEWLGKTLIRYPATISMTL